MLSTTGLSSLRRYYLLRGEITYSAAKECEFNIIFTRLLSRINY